MGWCWHKWRVVEKVEHPSVIEAMYAAGSRVTKSAGGPIHEQPVIVTYRCEKCGSEKVERV